MDDSSDKPVFNKTGFGQVVDSEKKKRFKDLIV